MRNRRDHADQAGFTLTEILVVVVLVSMVAAIIGYSFQRLLESNRSLEKRQDRVREARIALATFAADVRGAKAVLAASSEKVSLWIADSDSDGVAGLPELISYTYDRGAGPNARWTRESWNSRSELLPLADLRIAADTAPPGIRHVVVHLAIGSVSDSRWIGTSVLKREAYRAPLR